ncbi:MAG: type II toxin-antitoxin system HicB family antitoxin, partial [Gemmatimonadetes bacterium]|nr:type II toxin-antitoxin system HicB family antitoxin [Gemmatimonadota bacterium]
MKPMRYRGYPARIEYSDEDGCFVGRVAGIRDIITFHGESVGEVREAFEEAVEFYLESCDERGETPNKPYSGKLLLRIDPEVHAAVAEAAEVDGVSTNHWVSERLSEAVVEKERASTTPKTDSYDSNVKKLNLTICNTAISPGSSSVKTAVLLGAGSSIPAGFPSTKKLTQIVRSGKGVTRESDSSYYIDFNSAVLQEGTTTLVIELVNHLHEVQRQYYEHYGLNRTPNYEDIAYLISQGCEQWKGEIDNPVVLSFIDRLRSDMASEVHELEQYDFKTCINHTENEDLLASLLEESLNYIVDIVWRCLLGNPNSVRQLGVIKHICESSCVTIISTLCHDTHLETFLRNEGIGLADGFRDRYDSGIRYWNGGFSSNGSIPFLKLHGSIDWFELYPHGGTIFDNRVGIVSADLDCQRLQDGSGEWLDTTGRPMLLIGTFNKISQYSAG